ncbi:MAG TPA: hypothetical protein PKN13_12940 [Accumulibacter sp.]|nr:hypothetical protein [Accumulibacter sp.]HMW18657.1 hypothetical protein [Accumulibacter sp.]HMX23825.1 hypothetical protein [Accumulibacter sp.]HMY06267.1 hypothetical protein [Accumulibacter sp.]HNC18998.1 hypothetical protein [Accumulibacter sp.]
MSNGMIIETDACREFFTVPLVETHGDAIARDARRLPAQVATLKVRHTTIRQANLVIKCKT